MRQSKRVAILLLVELDEKIHPSAATRLDNKPGWEENPRGFPHVEGAEEVYAIKLTGADNSAGPRDFSEFLRKLTAPVDVKVAMDTAAHELGHVLSEVFEIPGGMQDDPRSKMEVTGSEWFEKLTPEQHNRLCLNEAQAWKIGQIIRPETDPNEPASALATYNCDVAGKPLPKED